MIAIVLPILAPEIALIGILASINAFITPMLLAAFAPPPVQASPIFFIISSKYLKYSYLDLGVLPLLDLGSISIAFLNCSSSVGST